MPRGRGFSFDPNKIAEAYAAAPGKTRAAKVREVCRVIGCSPGTVNRAVKGRTGRGALTRSPAGPRDLKFGRATVLPVGHPATVEHRTLFPTMVFDVGGERVLKDGQHSAKIGGRVTKGPWKGFPIFTLTLEERKTCPVSCRHWASCLTPDTPVLTAELRWVPLGSIIPGDRIAAFDEFPSEGHGRRTRIGIVEAVGRSIEPCYRIITDHGEVIASAPHLWLRRRSRFLYKWWPTERLKVGDKLQFFADPWEIDRSYDAGRLRGFVEGEGTCGLFKRQNSNAKKVRISWSQRPTKLCDETVELAANLGFRTSRYERIAGVSHTAISHINILGGWRETVRFLGRIRPTRMIEKAEDLWSNQALGQRAGRYATIKSIEFLGDREVVTIKTSTRTLVAAGFFTHNCYGSNMPYARRWRHGPELEWRLRREVAALELDNPGGFAVRLHSLGDFFSVGYVRMWRELLEAHPALHVFGYTARVDTSEDEIAYELALLVRDYWVRLEPPRFAVRFSNALVFARSTVTIESPVQRPADAVICPAQYAETPSGKKAQCCGSCALCWDTWRRIAFLQH